MQDTNLYLGTDDVKALIQELCNESEYLDGGQIWSSSNGGPLKVVQGGNMHSLAWLIQKEAAGAGGYAERECREM